MLLTAATFAITSCDDSDESSTSKPPVITLGEESARYRVKQGKDLIIEPDYENVTPNTTYVWKKDGKIVCNTPNYTFTEPETGEYLLSIQAINDFGAAQEELKVTVLDLNAPLITLQIPEDGFKVIQKQQLNLTPEVENGDNSTFEWTLDNKVVSSSKDYTFSSEDTGMHSLSLRATNEDGEDNISFNVNVCTPAEMPFSWSFPQTTYNIAVGRSMKVKAYFIENAFDGEYTWSLDDKVVAEKSKPEYIYNATDEGTHHLTLTMKNEFTEVAQDFVINVCPPVGTYRRPSDASSKSLVSKVFDFTPAPGHQVNGYMYGGTFPSTTSMDVVTANVLEKWNNVYSISLGACGGYVIAGFDHSVPSGGDDYDLIIFGNPYGYQSEPGIIWVSQDENGDGIPNDTWYELKGSEYDKGTEQFEYAIRYFKPTKKQSSVKWVDNDGNSGIVPHMTYWNSSDSYYQPWLPSPSVTFYCSRLKDESSYVDGFSSIPAMDWGYTDNQGSDYFDGPLGFAGHFKISNAMTFDGKPANLEYIDFVKVHTSQTGYTPNLGEISVEIHGIYDYHLAKK